MRLLIVSHGSRGDVQPYIALGRALAAAGHDVVLGTHKVFEAFIKENGLRFVEAGGDVLEQINRPEAKQWIESETNLLRFVKGFRELMGPELRQSTEQVLAACRAESFDAIIGSGTGFYSAFSVADALKIPYIHAFLQPVHPTGAYPAPLFPPTIPLGPIYNYLTFIAFGQLFWNAVESIVNGIRRDLFDLPPISRLFGPISAMKKQLVLYGFSPKVLPPSANWPPHVHVTGYWFLDTNEWSAPSALEQFLAAGAPPVCIGFGSMSDNDSQSRTQSILAALEKTNDRAILVAGWGGLTQVQNDDRLFAIDQAPHHWLFPRCAAIVNHAGAGTTAAVFRSGIPGIPVPFFADQPFWANRAHHLGVATRPIQRRQLTADALTQSIIAARSRELHARARRLGAQIEQEHGAEKAATLITNYLNHLRQLSSKD
jgi:sterol 3beta-glucosyltransferase